MVNTVNCVGIMGKGVAQLFKRRYPSMFDDYRARCEAGEVHLGEPYLFEDLAGASILNFPTKDHWKSASRIADIESGLDFFLRYYKQWRIESIAFPPLGCGNGGLEWSDVGPLLFRKLSGTGIDVELYAPFNTPKTHLTEEFLAQSQLIPSLEKGRQFSRVQPGWVVLFEVVRRLQEQPHASLVGRTIFQKIGYVMSHLGVPTGLEYGKGRFGPFSADLDEPLTVLANKNWWVEESRGSMKRLRVRARFTKESTAYRSEIAKFESEINQTVDLFCRIKSTTQAEEVSTVLYAANELKRKKRSKITEKELFDYILEWKSRWDSNEGHTAITEAIQNLEMLGWIELRRDEATA